jgi:hypothetical protein
MEKTKTTFEEQMKCHELIKLLNQYSSYPHFNYFLTSCLRGTMVYHCLHCSCPQDIDKAPPWTVAPAVHVGSGGPNYPCLTHVEKSGLLQEILPLHCLKLKKEKR